MPQTRAGTGAGRRAQALSREVVVSAAVALLDEHGERGLTFRLLTERLRTGAGAVYWHVANKDELVSLAADRVLGEALATHPGSAEKVEVQIRALAIGVFEALDHHPWAGRHVTASPALANALRLIDRIGTLLTTAGLPADRRFAVSTAIFNYITGVSAQITGAAIAVGATTSRDAFLAKNAERWRQLDPDEYPFLTHTIGELRDHDDRDQFITGLDLLLGGLSLALYGRPLDGTSE